MDLVFAYLAGLLTLDQSLRLASASDCFGNRAASQRAGTHCLGYWHGHFFRHRRYSCGWFWPAYWRQERQRCTTRSVGHGWVWAGDLIAKAILGIFTHARRHPQDALTKVWIKLTVIP